MNGQVQPDPVKVLWSVPTDAGFHVSLISHPAFNYVIAQTDQPFMERQDFDEYSLPWGQNCISLGRPDAGQLAIALITALITNSDELIGSYIDQQMAR